MLKIARCTVDWRSIRDLNSGGATNALSHFECDPFDLLGNAPYSNPPKSSPEKGEKSRREQQIFNCRKQWIFDDGSLENQEKLPKCLLDFESISLRPLRYVCLFSFYRTALAQRLEKCEISMQDNDEKLGTRHPIKPAVMGFPADKVACRMQTFECSLLRALGQCSTV